jgi:hypothetical protein
MKFELRLLAACLVLLLTADHALSREPADTRACPPMEQLRPLLNSERIQSCFGSYGVEVIEQQGNLRISSLYSHAADNSADNRITRTLAISEFADGLPDSLQEAYAAIRAGASMGATLQASGWRVDKRHRYLGEVPASTNVRCMSGMPANQPPQQLAAQVYDLWVMREDEEVRFALLAELHDPSYLTLQDLRQIYPEQANQLQVADKTVQQMLQRAARSCAQR